MIRLWLCASCADDAEAKARDYSLRVDLAAGTSSFTYQDENGAMKSAPSGAVGLIGVSTDENMGGHAASLSFVLAHPFGHELRRCVLPQDMLLVEALTPDGWDVLFDGFASAIHWSEEGSEDHYRHHFEVAFEGGHRMLSQGWENWQGVLRAGDSKIAGGAGSDLMSKMCKENAYDKPERMVKLLLAFGLDKLLDIRSRGTRIGSSWFRLGTGEDWKTDFDFTVFMQKFWYLRQSGSMASIIGGLIEPEVHEFFLTYRAGAPTWIFRPHPFPGPKGDDARWNRLAKDAIWLGCAGAPGCLGTNGSKNDARRANVFHWAGSSGSPFNGNQFLGKLWIGCWANEAHIRKYGYAARQIQTSLVGISKTNDWLTRTAPKLVERIAWQESPLPWLEQQTRHYVWLPSRVEGLHIGKVVYDASGYRPVTGYLISVQHSVEVTPEGVRAYTVLGLDRACVDVEPSQYPDRVRSFLGEGPKRIEYAQAMNGEANGRLDDIEQDEAPTGVTVAGCNPSWASPLPGAKVGDGVGVRFHPKLGQLLYHKGTDLNGVPAGTPIKAPTDGRVIAKGTDAQSGNWVQLRDAWGYTHIFAHLQAPSPKAVGSSVAAGETLGAVGDTGLSTGPHLHWGVRAPSGRVFDPFAGGCVS